MTKGAKLIAALGIGFLGGLFVQRSLNHLPLSPERALSKVKASAKQVLTIDGAWIFLQKEPWSNGKLAYEVYKGGLTEKTGDEVVHYDFIVDAQTGTLLSLEAQVAD
ncbi:peptidase M4 [Pullulanibacillus camelliae]|uniref:Peptidase M4 n=1 Tax=Pullulanibacillus camelliae TaxID=1707096 RepID=A0A8J3E0Q8_9BACL|nr:PepSY domain-containing protein [Pullulanibacillus camelliae]GGE55205.1 peptidase M4 [Pullulanibacillus camelliae]